tara:strand:+ start:632 stop:2953 length:2322 start_codon:yes stop_codon:yes gene_type:complete
MLKIGNSKDQLAKLMASEDITVRHSTTAKTASFDVKGRVLTLPNWKFDDTDIVDLLIGHEVGHALWTREEDWAHALENGLHKDITNIVEDARIERKIKAKYPGLVKCMVNGYRILEGKKFFYDWDDPDALDRMNVVDRINLHAKLGPLAAIPFSDSEQHLVSAVESTTTWESVEDCVRLIMDWLATSEEAFEQAVANLDDMGDGTYIDWNDDGEEIDPGDMGDDMDGDSDGEESETEPSGSKSADDKDSDDLSEEEGETALDMLNVETQERFDEMIENITEQENRGTSDISYFRIPDMGKNLLVNYKEAHHQLKCVMAEQTVRNHEYYHRLSGMEKTHDFADFSEFNTFKNKASKIVGYMAKEFERKKSAAEYRKESVSKTGVLDMSKIHQYKYNDDLFLRNTIRPDGKNHGLIMLFDWSASMTHHLHDTMKQTLALAWFCQKVNVPFEVYAYMSDFDRGYDANGNKLEDDERGELRREKNLDTWEEAKPGQAHFGLDGSDAFKLVNILSSRMNSKMFLEQTKNLFQLTHHYYSGRSVGHWGPFELTSTPLLEALCAMDKILPKFREVNNLDKLNMIILTDGEGNGHFTARVPEEGAEDTNRYIYLGGEIRLFDPQTKMVVDIKDVRNELEHLYRINNSTIEELMVLTMLKAKHSVNVIGMFIDGNSNGRRVRKNVLEKFLGWKSTRNWTNHNNIASWERVRKELRADGVCSVKWPAHDEYYIVPVGKLQESDDELNIDSDMSVGKMKNAFKKNLTQKFGNKILVNKMMDIIA